MIRWRLYIMGIPQNAFPGIFVDDCKSLKMREPGKLHFPVPSLKQSMEGLLQQPSLLGQELLAVAMWILFTQGVEPLHVQKADELAVHF